LILELTTSDEIESLSKLQIAAKEVSSNGSKSEEKCQMKISLNEFFLWMLFKTGKDEITSSEETFEEIKKQFPGPNSLTEFQKFGPRL
jgi:hypothetical protein